MGSVPQEIPLSDTYGASYIGVIIAAGLYGLTTLQTYFYYVNYPQDRPRLKLLVALLWFLDTLHMAVVAYCIYYYLVINYNNPPALAIGHWSLFISVGLCTIIAFIVRCAFMQKIHALCPKKFRVFVTTFIGIVVFSHLVFGIETVVMMFLKKELARLPEIRFNAVTPFVLMAVLSDLFIATALCILLWGSKTGFKPTNTIISKLITYAINRCLLTSGAAVGGLIVFAVAPQTLWFLALSFITGKLYANSLLATLNSRQAIRDISGETTNTVHVSQIGFHHQTSTGHHAVTVLSDMHRDQIEVNSQYETRIDKEQQITETKTDVSENSSDHGLTRIDRL